MRKKSLLIVFYILIVFIFAIFLTSCNESTVEELINDYGIMLEGGSFEDGSILVSEEIKFNTEEGKAVLESIASKNYNKDGNVYIFDIYVLKNDKKIQPNGKVKITIPVANITIDNNIVFHIKDNQEVEEIEPKYDDGKIIIEVDGFSYFVIVEKPHEHTYNSVLTDPTCEEKGYTTYTCSCGESYIDQYVDNATADDILKDIASVEKLIKNKWMLWEANL